ncbi:MAG: hypothetical protein AABY09_05160 [Nanoarchaeota archaeon]
MKETYFRAELRKSGGKLWIEVPKNLAGEIGAVEGGIVSATLSLAVKVSVPDKLLKVYRDNMPEVSGFSNEELSVILDFHNREKVSGDKSKAELAMGRDYGNKMVDKFRTFKRALEKADRKAMLKGLEKAAA